MSKINQPGTAEHDNWQRQWHELAKSVSLILIERVLKERDLDELLHTDPAEDRRTDRCLRDKGHDIGRVAVYVALGLLEGVDDESNFNLDSLYSDAP